MKRLKHNSIGFTLIEAIISAVILSVLLTATVYIFLAGNQAWQVNEARVIVQSNLRKAELSILKDLQQTSSSVVTTPMNNSTPTSDIIFRMPNGVSGTSMVWTTNTIRYFISGINAGRLLRESGGVFRIVATDISAIQFTRNTATPDVVNVLITSSNTTDRGYVVSESINFQVWMRN